MSSAVKAVFPGHADEHGGCDSVLECWERGQTVPGSAVGRQTSEHASTGNGTGKPRIKIITKA